MRSRARSTSTPSSILVGLSGRGDKDLAEVLGALNKTLVVYLMAGPETPELARAAEAGGADLIEIGFPVLGSARRRPGDPARRGARARCGDAHRRLPREPARDTSTRSPCRSIPMTYASLLEAYGWERFAADARGAGAASLIVADLPVDVHPELRRVQLVAPTSTDERIALAAERTDGWLYLVTVAGTTGARDRALARARAARGADAGAHRRAALCRLRHLDARAGRRCRRARGRRRRRARRRCSRPRTARRRSSASSLSFARRSPESTSQSRATCHASAPASMCSKWPVCERTRSSHGSPAFRAAVA